MIQVSQLDHQKKSTGANILIGVSIFVSGLVILPILGLIIWLVFIGTAIQLGKYDYPKLETLQSDPIVSLRMPSAVELGHRSKDREGGFGGAPSSITYTFGINASKEEVNAFYRTKLAEMNWIPEYLKPFRDTSPGPGHLTGWCKTELNYWVLFRSQSYLKSKPAEWRNYNTVFAAVFSGRSDDFTCPK